MDTGSVCRCLGNLQFCPYPFWDCLLSPLQMVLASNTFPPSKLNKKPFQSFEITWAWLSKEPAPCRSWRKHHANYASQQQHRWSLWNQSPIHIWVPRQQVFPYSATGTRTRVARVRAEYPNQLDYGGSAVEWIKIKNKIIFTTRLVSVEFWSTQPDNPSSSDIQLGLDRAHFIGTVISNLWLIVLEGGANDRHGVCHHHDLWMALHQNLSSHIPFKRRRHE